MLTFISKCKQVYNCKIAICATLQNIANTFNVALSKGLKILVIAYQKSLSLAIGRSCRFYPSCSNYALWLLDFNKPLQAMPKIFKRIFMCNPLSRGGIDYPILEFHICPSFCAKNPQQKHIKYWLLPYKNPIFLATILHPKQIKGAFVIIKSFYKKA